MNRQIAEKADLFLSGLQGRYENERDFFLGIQAEFSSGNKTYELKAEATGTRFRIALWETAIGRILRHSGRF